MILAVFDVYVAVNVCKLQFSPHDAMQSTVMPQCVVHPSVTFRYRDHIGWNNSKIMSRLSDG